MPEKFEVADVDEFENDNDRVLVEVDGLEIAVFRIDGEYFAVLNYCVHQAGPLCEGDLTGRMTIGDDGWEWRYDDTETNITCPWHGWKFDVASGVNISDDRHSVPTFDVQVEDGRVYVER